MVEHTVDDRQLDAVVDQPARPPAHPVEATVMPVEVCQRLGPPPRQCAQDRVVGCRSIAIGDPERRLIGRVLDRVFGAGRGGGTCSCAVGHRAE